ncbi:sensor histidine kinase [Sulfurospirillum arcachonense]|uniref:sensor histidine kinase n=1 Tax=Sulfurospirillum arcachonense TaxID=57666 RepID=UPI000468F015|nr:ABC transporter substrate binding protein [Sulfurospirillum arcachonense]
MFKQLKIFLFTLLLSTSLYSQNNTTHILLLNSYHQGMTWTDTITNEVIKNFVFPGSIYSLHIEYMDTKRIYNKKYLKSLADFYKKKYKSINLKLILSTDNNAFDFLKKYRDDVFGNLPVVFSGVNHYHESMLKGYDNYTGIEEKTSTIATIEAMLKIHPHLKQIYVLNDYLKTGRALEQSIKEELKNKKFNVKFIYSEPLTINELKAKVSSFDDDTAVLLSTYYSDKNSVHVTQEFLKNEILNHSSVPVYCLAEYYLNSLIVGGKLISGKEHGKLMHSLAIEVLSGIHPSTLPIISESSNRFIFDYNALKKYEIEESQLPKDSLVINKSKTFYEKYTFLVNITTFFIILLFIAIFTLIHNVKKRKNSEKLLEKQLDFEQILIDNISIPIYYKDANCLYIGCNNAFSEIFGIDKKEIKGKSVFDVAPKNLAEVYYQSDKNLLNEKGYQEYLTQIQTKEGDSKDVIMQKNIFYDKQGNVGGIIGCYFDITEINKTKKEVEELNNNLEILVKNRTADLEESNIKLQDTLSNLERTQNSLHNSTKMANLGKLVASVTHEINTPLGLGVTGISHFESEILNLEKLYKEDNLSQDEFELYLDKSRKLAKTILTNLTRASQIIKSFKNIAIDQSREEKRVFNVKEYLDDILLSLYHATKNTKHTIHITCDENLHINSYPGLISQILTNLIMNSIIHGFENKEKGLISINIFINDKENCTIIYEDDGQGMDEITKQNICKPYYTTKEGKGGSGLGMSIIHDIVTKQLKGTLNIESKKDSYSKFEIVFPLKQEPLL